MSHSHILPLLAGDKPQKFYHVVKVVERLADAHQHHAVHALAAVLLRRVYLVEHLRRQQIALEPGDGRRAEGAAHPAARLRRNAQARAVLVVHQHRLHRLSVVQTVEVLDRPVYLRDQLPLDPDAVYHISVLKPASHRSGKVCHILKAQSSLFVEPGKHLLCPERRKAARFEFRRQLVERHRFYVNTRLAVIAHASALLSNAAMKNPSEP